MYLTRSICGSLSAILTSYLFAVHISSSTFLNSVATSCLSEAFKIVWREFKMLILYLGLAIAF